MPESAIIRQAFFCFPAFQRAGLSTEEVFTMTLESHSLVYYVYTCVYVHVCVLMKKMQEGILLDQMVQGSCPKSVELQKRRHDDTYGILIIV